jgi:predicted RND superfamily exporter protein
VTRDQRAGSIGFGVERLCGLALSAPGFGLAFVALITVLAALSVAGLRIDDAPGRLYAPTATAFGAAPASPFLDPADLAVLLDADLAPRRAALVDALGADALLDRAAVSEMIAALPAPEGLPDMFAPPGAPAQDAQTDAADVLAAILVGPGAGATTLIAPPPATNRLDAARSIVEAVGAAEGATLTGLPIARLELMETLASQQPLLLGGGLAVGFALGALLLGSLADAAVIAATPILAILWSYGVLGALGIEVTLLVNNLPLLVLALAFSASIHLVYAVRPDLEAAGWAPAALRAPLLRVGGAVALSMLTTALAFASFGLSGSAAIVEFGAAGGLAVLGVLVAALLALPVVLWVALRLGWRPRASGRAAWPIARVMEAVGAGLARAILRRRRVALALCVAAVAGAGALAATLEVRHAIGEDIPADSKASRDLARAAASLGGAAAVVLPLPIRLDGAVNVATLAALRRAHEAAERALPDAHVVSPHSLLRWLSESGRPVTRGTVEAALAALPARHLDALLAPNGATALVARLPAVEAAAIAGRIAALEQAVGAALDADLAGATRGLAADLTRGPAIVRNVALGLGAAAVAAAALAALAFRRARVAWLTLLPNVTPILLVLASLRIAGRPLDLVGAMALTVALGIAVDNTVHVTAAYRRWRAKMPRDAALEAAVSEQCPILATATLVLCLGLAPALWSWSPAIADFAALMMLTLLFGLVADLVMLPALIAASNDGEGDDVSTSDEAVVRRRQESPP